MSNINHRRMCSNGICWASTTMQLLLLFAVLEELLNLVINGIPNGSISFSSYLRCTLHSIRVILLRIVLLCLIAFRFFLLDIGRLIRGLWLLLDPIDDDTNHRVVVFEVILWQVLPQRIGAARCQSRWVLLDDLIVVLVPALVVNYKERLLVGTLNLNLNKALQPNVLSVPDVNFVTHLDIIESTQWFRLSISYLFFSIHSLCPCFCSSHLPLSSLCSLVLASVIFVMTCSIRLSTVKHATSDLLRICSSHMKHY